MDVPDIERWRRQDVSNYSAVVAVSFNGKEVSRTRPASLSSDFELAFREIFPLRITSLPSNVTLHLLESTSQGLRYDHVVAKVSLSIPDSRAVKAVCKMSQLKFSTQKTVMFPGDQVRGYSYSVAGVNQLGDGWLSND